MRFNKVDKYTARRPNGSRDVDHGLRIWIENDGGGSTTETDGRSNREVRFGEAPRARRTGTVRPGATAEPGDS